jgi:hypothetical protein
MEGASQDTSNHFNQRPHKMLKTSECMAQEVNGRFFEEQYLLDMLLHDLGTNAGSDLDNISKRKKPVSPTKKSSRDEFVTLPAPRHFVSRIRSENVKDPSLADAMFEHTTYRAIFNHIVGPTAYM